MAGASWGCFHTSCRSFTADLLPRTRLVAAVGKPLRVLEFGTERAVGRRGEEAGDGLGGAEAWENCEGVHARACVCVCVHHLHLADPQTGRWLSGKQG